MKLVVAVIRPERYGAVYAALDELGITQLTLTEVWGQGHERGSTLIYRSATIQDKRLKRFKLEVAVEDAVVDSTIEAIQRGARTGRVGDGVILVAPLEEFIRIRAVPCRNEVEQQGTSVESVPSGADSIKLSYSLSPSR